MKNSAISCAIMAICIALISAETKSATTTSNFGVNLNVLSSGSCSFGGIASISSPYDPGSPSATEGYGWANVLCTTGTAWTLTFDQGQHADIGSNCIQPMRRAASGGSYVEYSLYRDSARTQAFGCDATTEASGIGNGSSQINYAYFRIPQGQVPTSSGLHSDIVTMTITF